MEEASKEDRGKRARERGERVERAGGEREESGERDRREWGEIEGKGERCDRERRGVRDRKRAVEELQAGSLSVGLSVCLSVRLPACQSASQAVSLLVCLYDCVSVCLIVCCNEKVESRFVKVGLLQCKSCNFTNTFCVWLGRRALFIL